MSQTRITRDDVRRIARLARLSLSEDEIEAQTRDLLSIVDHFAKLEELELPALAPPSGAVSATRADEAAPSLDANALRESAPVFEGAHFIVPRIVG